METSKSLKKYTTLKETCSPNKHVLCSPLLVTRTPGPLLVTRTQQWRKQIHSLMRLPFQWRNKGNLPSHFTWDYPVSTLKVLHPRKPISLKQTRAIGHPGREIPNRQGKIYQIVVSVMKKTKHDKKWESNGEGVTTILYRDTRKGLSDTMTFEERRKASHSDKWGKRVPGSEWKWWIANL